MKERMAVLGGGSWGAALGDHLAKVGHAVTLWEVFPNAAETLQRTRRLSVLPQLDLHPRVEVTSDAAAALRGQRVVVNAVPSEFVRSTFKTVRETQAMAADAWVVSVSKGIEIDTLKRMSEVIVEELPALKGRVAVLSGPSHAEEVVRDIPSAVVSAGPPELAAKVQSLFTSDSFRVYTSDDVIGVELGGALKNIYAIATGACDGLGLGDNTKAALMTRGLNEMVRLGLALGAKPITLFGLSGLGDLIVTCLSRHSRNRLIGEKVGQGKTLDAALKEMTMVAEGVRTTKSVYNLCLRQDVDLPIVTEIYRCLYEGKSAKDSLRDLLHRPVSAETTHLQQVSLLAS